MQTDPSARQIHVCVVGTGALGSALLDRLRQHGFGSVTAIDPDGVEPRNLLLSPLLRRALEPRRRSPVSDENLLETGLVLDGNPPKVVLLAEHAARENGLSWRALACEIADAGWQQLQEADLICCCTDSVLSRVETAFIARVLHKPMLDGAVFGDGIAEGRITLFPATPEAACYLCGLREDRRAAVLGNAASASLGCLVPEDTLPMTGTLTALSSVADRMLQAILHWPENTPATRYRIHAEPGAPAQDHDAGASVHLARSLTCPWHEGLPETLWPLPWEAPLAVTLGARELQLPWPVCTEATCPACGHRSTPMVRVAFVRRRSACTCCGHPGLQPTRCVHRLRAADSEAQMSPRQLGQPRQHLYWMVDLADMNSSAYGGAS